MGSGSCARASKHVSSTEPLAGIAVLVALAPTAAQVVTPAELSPPTVTSRVEALAHVGVGDHVSGARVLVSVRLRFR
jgi:hypothetical protein